MKNHSGRFFQLLIFHFHFHLLTLLIQYIAELILVMNTKANFRFVEFKIRSIDSFSVLLFKQSLLGWFLVHIEMILSVRILHQKLYFTRECVEYCDELPYNFWCGFLFKNLFVCVCFGDFFFFLDWVTLINIPRNSFNTYIQIVWLQVRKISL